MEQQREQQQSSASRASADSSYSKSPALALLDPPSLQFKSVGNEDTEQEEKKKVFEKHSKLQSSAGDDATLRPSRGPADDILQNKSTPAFLNPPPFQLKVSKSDTGLPDDLKSGIENLSGYSMDDVKVHYNSDKPAQFKAHAYAQGSDIHVASGQEKHLPHEAWHVVQQKQGRVQPTVQMKGNVQVNDDPGLEKEADAMGTKAIQGNNALKTNTREFSGQSSTSIIQQKTSSTVIQRGIMEDWKKRSYHGKKRRSSRLKKIDGLIERYNAIKELPETSKEEKQDVLREISEAVGAWREKKTNKKRGFASVRSESILELEQQISDDLNSLDIDTDYNNITAFGMAYSQGKDNYSQKEYEKVSQNIQEGADNVPSDHTIRLAMLSEKLKTANEQLRQQQETVGGKHLGVFTAPEWFFKKPDEPYNKTEKTEIVQEIREISTNYPNILIIPGSILWRETEQEGAEKYYNTAVAFLNGLLLKEINKYNEGLDTTQYEGMKDQLEEEWVRGGSKMGQNTSDDSNLLTSSIFQVGNVKFSLEICADHNDKRARKELLPENLKDQGYNDTKEHIERNGVDVQVLVSASAYLNNARSTIKKDGIGISNDATLDVDKNTFAKRQIYKGGYQSKNKIKELNSQEDLENPIIGSAPLPPAQAKFKNPPIQLYNDGYNRLITKFSQIDTQIEKKASDISNQSNEADKPPVVQMMRTADQWISDSDKDKKFGDEKKDRSPELRAIDEALRAYHETEDPGADLHKYIAKKDKLDTIMRAIETWKKSKGKSLEKKMRFTDIEALAVEVEEEYDVIDKSFEDQQELEEKEKMNIIREELQADDKLEGIEGADDRARKLFEIFMQNRRGKVKYVLSSGRGASVFEGGNCACATIARGFNEACKAYGLEASSHELPKPFITEELDKDFIDDTAVGNIKMDGKSIEEVKRYFFSRHYVSKVNDDLYFCPTSGKEINADGEPIIWKSGFHRTKKSTVDGVTIEPTGERTADGGGVYLMSN